MPRRPVAAQAVLVIALIPCRLLAWSGRVHVDIARAAASAVPDEMAAWRAYAKVLARHSVDPDLWKDTDPAEGVRHYLDAERYREVALTELPANWEAVRAQGGRRLKASAGIGPWVVWEAQMRLTAAMASNDWVTATRWAAAQAHYAADLHQPLHTTRYFDEAKGTGAGVHLRWEVEMPKLFWHASLLRVEPATYLEDPWRSLLGWVAEAHERYGQIFQVERVLAERGVDAGTFAYYRELWKATDELFVEQASRAVTHLASLWYTAWVNAGRPAIPPPAEISSSSVWIEEKAIARAPPEASAWFFAGGLVAATILVVGLSLWQARSRRRPFQAVGFRRDG